MKIAIRVDASREIGIGHVMRCLTLADELKKQNAIVHFISRAHDGHLENLIQEKGYTVSLLPCLGKSYKGEMNDPVHANWLGTDWETDAEETIANIQGVKLDWFIVDHYAIDSRWHNALRKVTSKIMVIDDLADRKLNCDLLLDQTFGRQIDDYRLLVPENCQLLLGSKFALLRPEFAKQRTNALKKRKSFEKIDCILVTMGGMDPANMTGYILDVLSQISWENIPVVNVVLNKLAPNLQNIIEQAKTNPLKVNVLTNVNNMAELMLEADFCMGAAGATSWERCTLGLPSAVIALAENQNTIFGSLEKAGAHITLDKVDDENFQFTVARLSDIFQNIKALNKMSKASFNICDGRGVHRVGLEFTPCFANDGQPITLVDATIEDAKLIFEWQCHPITRRYANNSEVPTWDTHLAWMEKKLSSDESYFWIIKHLDEPSGVLRFDPVVIDDRENFLISIFIAPEKYQLGIASKSLEVGKRVFAESTLFAEVMDENKASVSLFQKAGFMYREDISHYEWKLH